MSRSFLGNTHGAEQGRLGNLGTIPDKYDVAITTACGSLNNMVVDTVQQGQACIEYLRKQNVGRANFLVLEKIDETNSMRPIQTPENVPRLFDLVKPKEARFAHAFYKGLRDTLVAQDLAQANRIAFGGRRWRVVTLAGELIDSSGTMSGGGAKPRGGGMSSKLAADAVQPEVLRSMNRTANLQPHSLRRPQMSSGKLKRSWRLWRSQGRKSISKLIRSTLIFRTLGSAS
jgi:structural maintenance of chromosome 4